MTYKIVHTLSARSIVQALAGLGEAVRTDVLSRFEATGGSLERWSRYDHDALACTLGLVETELLERSEGRLTPVCAGIRALQAAISDAIKSLDLRDERPTVAAAPGGAQ